MIAKGLIESLGVADAVDAMMMTFSTSRSRHSSRLTGPAASAVRPCGDDWLYARVRKDLMDRNRCQETVGWPVIDTSLRPTMEAISSAMKKIRQALTGSLKNTNPMMAVPPAPIPVHAA